VPSVEPAETPYGPDDSMGRLWVPHRMMYIKGEDKPATPNSTDCPFCDQIIVSDNVAGLKEKLVVAKGIYCYVILNLFPYNSGHMLVLPYRHIPGYIEMHDEEAAEFYRLSKQAIIAAQKAMNPQGFNIGINQGSIAGAGIAAHLHQHIVPRWTGDANFLPIIGQTKAMPQFLGDTRDQLAANWPQDASATIQPVV
jgi:ATP adenylyltransferase